MLRMQLESTIKSDYSWMRTSRKGWDMDAVMPGMKTNDAIDIAVAIDTSGSISPAQCKDFLSEIQGIMESFDSYRIHVFTFDTETYNPQQYDSDNLEDITDYDIQGGGGTDFDAIFKYLKHAEIEPKKLVVFTDGYHLDPGAMRTTVTRYGSSMETVIQIHRLVFGHCMARVTRTNLSKTYQNPVE